MIGSDTPKCFEKKSSPGPLCPPQTALGMNPDLLDEDPVAD
jgi:hypothetical protein